MFWYCIILDAMFVLATLALFIGVVVFVWAEEKRALAAVITVVASIVTVQWAFRIVMVFTCLWKFQYPVGRGVDMPMPLAGWAGPMA
jgi:exosortase/archaeosortase